MSNNANTNHGLRDSTSFPEIKKKIHDQKANIKFAKI